MNVTFVSCLHIGQMINLLNGKGSPASFFNSFSKQDSQNTCKQLNISGLHNLLLKISEKDPVLQQYIHFIYPLLCPISDTHSQILQSWSLFPPESEDSSEHPSSPKPTRLSVNSSPFKSSIPFTAMVSDNTKFDFYTEKQDLTTADRRNLLLKEIMTKINLII